MSHMQIKVKGMHCPSCKMLIEEELEDAGCTNIKTDLNTESQIGEISFNTELQKEKITKIIQDQGDYKVE